MVKTIICGQFKQETNRYSPGLSDRKAYQAREYFFGEADVRGHFTGTKSELGAFSTNWIPGKLAASFRLWR